MKDLIRYTQEYKVHEDTFKDLIGYDTLATNEREKINDTLNKLGINIDELKEHVKNYEFYDTWLEEVNSKLNIEKNNKEIERIKKILKEGDKKEGIYELAHYVLKKYKVITIQDTEELFVYANGIYDSKGERIILSFLQKEFNDLMTNYVVSELKAHLRRETYYLGDELKESKDHLCLENGILDINTKEIGPHTPEQIFFSKLPISFEPNADCPKIKKFLKEVVNEEDVPVLQEIAGYVLLKDYPIQKLLMFVGSGSNGKSTFINLLKAFIGRVNCVSISLQELAASRFSVANLHGKLANLFADLSSKDLRDTAMLKSLTGGDPITCEKKFKSHFTFTNYAKLIFSCNRIPKSHDDSDAFFRRWIIINFPNQFTETESNKNLLKEITSQEELSGFLNLALEGLQRLIEQGHFTNLKAIDSMREEYTRLSDSVGAYILDNIDISPEDYVPKKDLYTDYTEYCRNNNYPIEAENTFHRFIQKQITVADFRPKIDNVRVHSWKGISLRKQYVQDVQDVQENYYLRKQSEEKWNINCKKKVDNPDMVDPFCDKIEEEEII